MLVALLALVAVFAVLMPTLAVAAKRKRDKDRQP